MTVVKVNVIRVRPGQGPELERLFALRSAETDGADGFLGTELWRPQDGADYFSVSRWRSEEDFRRFVAAAAADVQDDGWRERTTSSTELLTFEVCDPTGNTAPPA